MPFKPDIVVTEPASSHVLLLVEVKTTPSWLQSEAQLKRYMWEIGCPVGLFASPQSVVLYRNVFTGFSDDSVQKLGEYPSPHSWSGFENQGSEAEFATRVQSWLESLIKTAKPPDVPQETKDALSEYVLPSLLHGEIHAAGPRITA